MTIYLYWRGKYGRKRIANNWSLSNIATRSLSSEQSERTEMTVPHRTETTAHWEREIDQPIYQHNEFTEEEVKIIEEK